MKQIVMMGHGAAATFKLPHNIAPTGGTIINVKFITDTTVAANAADYWSGALTVDTNAAITAVTSATVAFTAATARAATLATAYREFAAGAVFLATITKVNNGADQSAVNWTCVVEYV